MRILFGSCNKHDHPQPLWEPIGRLSPAAYIWAGDAVYHDHSCGVGCFATRSISEMAAAYAAQRAVPGYAALRESGVPILGVWDDHDYGINDGDKHFPERNSTQSLFLDFLDEPADSARRLQGGVYGSHELVHPDGLGTVKVLLLDNRRNRDPYRDDGVGDFLGDEQWAWLEAELTASARAADVHLIVSGLQVLPEHRLVGESWSRFPAARRRLLALLLRLRVKAPVLLSGDVHYGELMEARCERDDDGASARLLEITSSGMTHAWGYMPGTFPDGTTVPPAQFGWLEANFHLNWAGWLTMHWVQRLMPFLYQRRGAVGEPQYMLGLNFGEVEVDWGRRLLRVALRDANGQPRHAASFALDELGSANSSPAQRGTSPRWLCSGHRGDVDTRHAAARFAFAMGSLLLLLLGLPLGGACCVARAARRRRRPKKKKAE